MHDSCPRTVLPTKTESVHRITVWRTGARICTVRMDFCVLEHRSLFTYAKTLSYPVWTCLRSTYVTVITSFQSYIRDSRLGIRGPKNWA